MKNFKNLRKDELEKMEMRTFHHPEFGDIRVYVGENGEVMFLAEDVSRALGYESAEEALRTIQGMEAFEELEIPEGATIQ